MNLILGYECNYLVIHGLCMGPRNTVQRLPAYPKFGERVLKAL